ncbi:hypothetical protein [Candidatus Endomicrobiellum trichonymphae]|uniref:hypothetical protein n=1 Tax=Endomicrobium trichonymphae TaxID=1408204 RepID=UPI000324FFA5|nr:hypothetical protein [Candidatus Endomicrobium trichonymphae]
MKGTSPELLENQFKEENILVDLRLHDKAKEQVREIMAQALGFMSIKCRSYLRI